MRKACRIQEGGQDTENETCKVFQEAGNWIFTTRQIGIRRPRLRLRASVWVCETLMIGGALSRWQLNQSS